MNTDALARVYREVRPELCGYLTRFLVRPAVAEEVAQNVFVHALEALDRCPDEQERVRAWLFRIATNLAIDETRRHGHRREISMLDLRAAAESSPDFVRHSAELIGTPETVEIAREHLATCFACTLHRFPEHHAAALLLREVHGFSTQEIAQWLESSPAQVKHWLQQTRAELDAVYADRCALIAKHGVCYQCAELGGYFQNTPDNPLEQTSGDARARAAILAELRQRPLGPWHRMLLDLITGIS